MSQASPPPATPFQTPLSKPDEQTEAGNYFVANYPPFSFWKTDQVPLVEAMLQSPAPLDKPLGLYFHIPFCRKRCHFCYFRVYTDKNADEIRAYIRAGLKEMAWYAEKPYLQGRKPKFVYFGGGTPSYLSPPQLHELVSGLKEHMDWDEAEEIAFECEPGTLNEKKLEAIRAAGVTRLSLGVENFDDRLLELNGRAHRGPEIERAYYFARSIGFPQINIDLIAGMMDETEENWIKNVQKLIELSPEMVTIYQMEVPYNTTIYKQMRESGQLTAPVADWPTKRRWTSYAFDELVKAGYTVTSTCTAVKDPAKHRFVYREGLFSGVDLLALGVASFGHLGGYHLQNHHDVGPYMEMIEQKGNALYRAYHISDEERFIREFILKLKLGHSSFDYYRQTYGQDPYTRFADQWARMVAGGYATVTPDDVTLTRDGLLQVDRLLLDFFLPQHRDARYS